MEDASENETKIEIKKVQRRNKNLRTRKISSDQESDDEESCSAKIEEMKVAQKLRERPHGVDIIELDANGGRTAASSSRQEGGDPFKVKSGGMVNLKNVNLSKPADDAYDVGIGTQFSAETNKRDEDEEMMKYIDQKISKKVAAEKGLTGEGESSISQQKYFTPEEAALQSVPDHLRTNSGARSEEMLSNQMLSGIPEVDLGIESKIRNIEATEEAKLKLILSQRNKADGPSDFVPTNVTVNFKVNAEAESRKRAEKRSLERSQAQASHGKPKTDKATDDLHYEKFKKHFRR